MNRLFLATLLLAAPAALMAVTPAKPSDMKLSYGTDADGNPAIRGEFKAPFTEEEDWWGDPGPDLTENIDMIEVLRKDPGSYDGTVVFTFRDVPPGQRLTFTDSNIEKGLEYEYGAVAYMGTDSSSTWGIYTSVFAGILPAAPKLKAESEKGSAPVYITVTAPELTAGDEPLEEALTSIQIFRQKGWEDAEMVKSFSYPVKGQTYTWTDDNFKVLTDGSSVTYQAIACTAEAQSAASTVTVTLLRDHPAAPKNVKASMTENGVLVEWSPVKEGAEGYWFDPSDVTYKVYRLTANGGKTLLDEGLSETTYLDPISDITSENSYAWQVVAVNKEGESAIDGGISSYMMLGPAAALPFAETFDTPGSYRPVADNFWEEERLEGWNSFEVNNEYYLYVDGVEPHYIHACGNDSYADKMKGFLMMDGSKWSRCEATFTSGRISQTGYESALLSFMYYAVEDSKSTLYVEIVDASGNVEELDWLTMDEETGWTSYDINIKDLADYGDFRLRLHAVTDPDDGESGIITPVCIDEISLTGATGVTATSTANAVATEYFDLSGTKVAAPAEGQIVVRRQTMEDGRVRVSKIVK